MSETAPPRRWNGWGDPAVERPLADHAGGSRAAVRRARPPFSSPPTCSGYPSRGITHEASGLGAAIDAAVGLGIHRDIESAVAAMVHIGEVRDPDPADHARYDERYRDVYRRMYGRLRPLYRDIRRITGYPTRRPLNGAQTERAALTTMVFANTSCQPCLVGLLAVV